MQEQNSKPDMPNDWDKLDRILNAGLSNYTAVEPRWGLEQRLLASLQAERSRIADCVEKHRTTRWHWIAFVAAMLLVSLTLANRYSTTSHPTVLNHPSPAAAARSPEASVASSHELCPIRGQHPSAIRRT